MPLKLPTPSSPSYHVGATADTSALYTGHVPPPNYTTTVFSFSDPGRAGKCLAALCRADNIKAALPAVLGSGCVLSSAAHPDDACLGGMCDPGDFWAIVVYYAAPKAYLNGRRTVPRKPEVICGTYADLRTSYYDHVKIPAADAAALSESFFVALALSRLG